MLTGVVEPALSVDLAAGVDAAASVAFPSLEIGRDDGCAAKGCAAEAIAVAGLGF